MADDITLRDVVNHMSHGFAQLNGRLDRVDKRLGAVESKLDRVEVRIGAVEQQLVVVNERLTGIEEDLSVSMEDVGVIKLEQRKQDRRLDRLEVQTGIAA